MILKQLHSVTQLKLRPAGIALALLAALLGGSAYTFAQRGNTPIIIADGSLTIESSGVPWSDFAGTGNTRYHPRSGNAVSQVVISMPGKNTTVTFAAQKCTVSVRYASTDITVNTGNDGRGLQVTTDFSSFHPGATPNHLAHNNANAKISRVTVTKDAQMVFDSMTSGGTRIEISYQ